MKSPSKKSVLEVAALTGGGVIGVMASRAAMGAIHEESTATGSDVAKYGKRALITGIGVAVALFVPATSAVNNSIKGAGIGMALIQVIDGVADFSAKNTTTAALATGSKSERLAAKALGLGCPGTCGGEGLGKPRRYGRGSMLRMPIEIPGELIAEAPVNGFEAKFLAAQQKAA